MQINHSLLRHNRWLFIGVLFLFCLTSCTDKNIYTFSTSQSVIVDTLEVKGIKLYLETSASMRGYVNSNVAGTYPLKDVVPFIVTDLDNHFDVETKLITISDRQKQFPYSKDRFFEQLRSGRIFTGKSSKLQNIFTDVISKTKRGEVSILISDCIPDLGNINTKTEGSKITSHIYPVIKANSSLGVAVFQFKSDFNGTYYYNRKNNNGVVQSKRPYYKETLNNRPFYIWVFGEQALVTKVLSTNIIKDYNASHAYNISLSEMNAGLLEKHKSGKIAINTDKQTLLIKEIDAKRPAIFTIGIDGGKLSEVQQEQLLDSKRYTIMPDHIAESLELVVKDKATLLSEKIKDKSEIQNSKYTHFIQPTLNDFELETTEFSINIFNKEPQWINKTSLDDDVGVSIDALEHKTFGFNFITYAFAKAYPATAPQIQFILTKQKQD
ncbi:hypothetical protein [uncultured Algibacter sp.]|uniref:hypothetical protein n=1 Tax=uncultured Algibacter sp. TaxID=298659 RepID=UPI003217A4CE